MRIVPVWPREIEEFRGIVDDTVIDDLRERAKNVDKIRVLHINSTEYGGGVAEVLLAQIPLLEDLGISAQWGVIDGDEHFFEITKSIHNGFQGDKSIPWEHSNEVHYLSTVEQNLASLPDGFDIAVVHDPQPM